MSAPASPAADRGRRAPRKGQRRAGGGGPETRLGIFGGTFDPPHTGHLVAAECALHTFALERVLFVPAARPPHKLNQVCATAEQRYRMVRLAVAGNPRFEVSRVEMDRAGPSYTVDTLAALAAERGEASLFCITGIDAVLELATWREPERLLATAVFVAVSRPGVPSARLEAFRAALPAGLRERIVYLPIPAIDISSHELRERVRAGLPIRYLVPDPVAATIARERLYQAEPRAASGSAPQVRRSGQA